MDAVIIVIVIFVLLIWWTHSKPTSKQHNDKISNTESEESNKAPKKVKRMEFDRNDLDSTIVYLNKCWVCHYKIDSRKNQRCPYCGWYICLHCGACKQGCNREEKESAIKEMQRKVLSEKVKNLEVGSTIIHVTFGRMEVTRIEKGIIYLATTDGVEKKFVNNDTLINYIDKIL